MQISALHGRISAGWAACVSLMLLQLSEQVCALGCYKCTSTNSSNKPCEDPFNSIDQVYEKDCFAPRPHRRGLFPGTQCLKMKYCLNDVCTWVRGCVADNGGMNSDNEIGRTDHCGFGNSEIMLNNQKVYGCITSCHNDGCNGVSAVSLFLPLISVPVVAGLVIARITLLELT